MITKDDFKDEDGKAITIQFKDCSGLKLLITKAKNWLISN